MRNFNEIFAAVKKSKSQSVLANGNSVEMASSLPSSQSGGGGIFNFMKSSEAASNHRSTSQSVSSASTPRNVKFNTKRSGSGDAPSDNNESDWLRSRINQLEHELQTAKQSIQQLQKREETLMNRISDSIQRKVESSGSFETLSDSNRPSQLIERYSQLLYCELRPDAMDALDDIVGVSEQDDLDLIAQISDSPDSEAIAHSTDLKQKILFSIVVLSFRSVQRSIEDSTRQIFVLLGVSDNPEEMGGDAERKTSAGGVSFSLEDKGSNSSTPTGSPSDSPVHKLSVSSSNRLSTNEDELELQKIVTEQMRKTAASRNIEPNYTEVCEQLFQTLFDYPSLKTCKPLLTYIKECCKLAWLLLLSNPSYHINYHQTHFDSTFMNRFYSSDMDREEIASFIWPALVEQSTGHCVSKAIVIT